MSGATPSLMPSPIHGPSQPCLASAWLVPLCLTVLAHTIVALPKFGIKVLNLDGPIKSLLSLEVSINSPPGNLGILYLYFRSPLCPHNAWHTSDVQSGNEINQLLKNKTSKAPVFQSTGQNPQGQSTERAHSRRPESLWPWVLHTGNISYCKPQRHSNVKLKGQLVGSWALLLVPEGLKGEEGKA